MAVDEHPDEPRRGHLGALVAGRRGPREHAHRVARGRAEGRLEALVVSASRRGRVGGQRHLAEPVDAREHLALALVKVPPGAHGEVPRARERVVGRCFARERLHEREGLRAIARAERRGPELEQQDRVGPERVFRSRAALGVDEREELARRGVGDRAPRRVVEHRGGDVREHRRAGRSHLRRSVAVAQRVGGAHGRLSQRAAHLIEHRAGLRLAHALRPRGHVGVKRARWKEPFEGRRAARRDPSRGGDEGLSRGDSALRRGGLRREGPVGEEPQGSHARHAAREVDVVGRGRCGRGDGRARRGRCGTRHRLEDATHG